MNKNKNKGSKNGLFFVNFVLMGGALNPYKIKVNNIRIKTIMKGLKVNLFSL